MITIFGIRHHGPGSARSLCAALDQLRPDLLLVEGPPEADEQIFLAAQAGMQPPVALLLYLPGNPQQSVYYPLAEFSPEWQAIQYGLKNNTPVRFMDLPQAAQLGETSAAAWAEDAPSPDPFAMIAEAAGYPDGERWWEHFVEARRGAGQAAPTAAPAARRGAGEVFQGILELMTALRGAAEQEPSPVSGYDQAREACMRTAIRRARAEGYQNIAAVCGAWHAPALVQLDDQAGDAALLKDLPGAEVAVTWVPWTYDRLSRRSGYGAGIEAPGWYEHLWQTRERIVEGWMVKVARLMRAEDLGISPAHAIEATRLAETLAALRGRPLPGLAELDEAVLAVFCFGDQAPLSMVRQALVVGQRLGQVPAGVPCVPLQRDLAALQKRLRFEPSVAPELIDLDLRKPLLLERSRLLHRLALLGIPWGQLQTARNAKGTFHERWQIAWKPEFAVAIIEASLWGSTVLAAASSKVGAEAAQAAELPALTRLVEAALMADLDETVPGLMARLQQVAATSGDLAHLMAALPPLAAVLRYGDVRKTGAGAVSQVVNELVARICIGLPGACAALDDEAAQAMFEHINAVQHAVELLQDEPHGRAWARALAHLCTQDGVHGLVQGRACRLLFEAAGEDETTARHMSRALSPGTPPGAAAAWVQGFLHGSGQALIHHPRLWRLVDEWVVSLPEALFASLLPVLRRTFSAFPGPERRQVGELARHGGQAGSAAGQAALDPRRAGQALALVIKILEKG